MKRSEPNRKLNIWVARAVPVFLLGIIAYTSWVVTKPLCVDYLLNPPPSAFARKRTGAAIAILTIYYSLFAIGLACYGRLLDVVTRHPGLVPRGRQWYAEREKRTYGKHLKQQSHKPVDNEKSSDSETLRDSPCSESPDVHAVHDSVVVEEFWQRDVFTCKYDGRPDFCSTCYNWKPDRSHHCSELDRCVLKMDHFCPWVGGVVGETSFKFFIQFTFWAALSWLHVLVTTAYFTAQRRQIEGTVSAHWVVILALSGLFFLFGAGMCLSSTQFAFINSTTIENLNRQRKIWYLAVCVSSDVLQRLQQTDNSSLRLITYPRPPHEQMQMLEESETNVVSRSPEGLSAHHLQGAELPPVAIQRTFAILETAAGANPWDLGWFANFKDIMGYHILDWLLPIRPSPCINHDSAQSFYRLGPVVQQLRAAAGLDESSPRLKRSGSQKRRRHRARRSHSVSK